jgi:hypothetical protein
LNVPLYSASGALFNSTRNLATVSLVLPEFLCPSDRRQSVRPDLGPTNYSACSGTGVGGGTPFETDGLFFVNSRVRISEITDGTSKTVAYSEGTLGEKYPLGTQRAQINPRLAYAYAQSVPLTEAGCNAVLSTWNLDTPPGFSWANGEYRCALYNHRWGPNAAELDCVSNKITFPFDELYSAYGWRSARSYHAGGVTILLADGSAHFVRDGVNGVIWKEIATRAGGESSGAGLQ